MLSGLGFAVAIILLLATVPVRAQSLTPIRGWVPFDSPKAKQLMQNDPTVTEHQSAVQWRWTDR
jgi:hypothetical protein